MPCGPKLATIAEMVPFHFRRERLFALVAALLLSCTLDCALVWARENIINPADANSNATLWIGCPVAVDSANNNAVSTKSESDSFTAPYDVAQRFSVSFFEQL